MEIFIFIAGVFFGAAGMFILFFWLGSSDRFKHLDGSNPNLYHPQPLCTDGHKWCEEHAKQGKYHCTNCPYVLVQG